MLVVSFFEWLNLDRFQEKYKSVWILFMRSSLLSVRCECTLFTNLSDFAALSAESTLFFVVLRIAVSFALLSFMLMTADCFWTWVDAALFAESTLFFVVLRTAVSFASFFFVLMIADCFWTWVDAALSAVSTLFFVVLRTAVSFASLSFMLMIADCFWTWVNAALSVESTLFFVVNKIAVSFVMLSFMSMTADCFWIWVEFIQFCFMKSKVLVNLYWYTWSIKLSIVVSWSIDNVLISFLQVITLLIFSLSLTLMNLMCSWWEAEINEALFVNSALIISSLFTYMCFWSIRIWCNASHIKASSMIKSIWNIT